MRDSSLSDRRILVVEDDFLIAMDLQTALQAAQAVVLGPAERVQDGLDLLVHEPEISAAVLDVRLGREMVVPLADALLEGEVPFLFTTGEPTRAIPPRFAST